MRSLLGGPPSPLEDQVGVTRQITDRRVDLGQGQT